MTRNHRLLASWLVFTVISSASCTTPSSEHDIDEESDTDGSETDVDDESRASVNDCIVGRIHFNGQCRAADFFERFVSVDAELAGIAGPTSKLTDTGVIVTETFENGLIQNIYIDPYKYPANAPLDGGFEYRSNYRVVLRTTHSGWITSQGQAGWMETGWTKTWPGDFNPARFGLSEWTVHISTPGGYQEFYSDGTGIEAVALTNQQQACQAQVDVVAADFTAKCTTSGAVAAAAAGIVAGATVFIGMNASVIFAGPPAAAGGISTGFGTTAFFGAASYAVCNAIGNKIKADGHLACLNPPSTTQPSVFRPDGSADAGDFGPDDCAAGMVNYSGEASFCVDGPDGSSFTDGEVVVDDNYTCMGFIADGMCLPTSAFG